MRRSRFLIATGYWLALILVTLPALDLLTAVLPTEPGQIRWRLRAFGLLSQAILLPLLGGVVGMGTAVLLSHRRVVRVLSILAALTGLGLLVLAVLFGLDLLQYTPAVGSELREQYRTTGGVYLASVSLAALFLFWTAAVGWRAARRSKRRSERQHHARRSGRGSRSRHSDRAPGSRRDREARGDSDPPEPR